MKTQAATNVEFSNTLSSFFEAVRMLWAEGSHKRALLFVLRTLRWPRVTCQGYRAFASSGVSPENRDWVANTLSKLHRPYINAHWTAAQRLSAMIAHYQTIAGTPLHECTALTRAGGHTLVCTALADGVYRLILRSAPSDSKEGELELVWETDQGQRLVVVVFSFVKPPPCPTIVIGCLQGARPEARSHVEALSHAFHGMPVKLLIVKAMQHLTRNVLGPTAHLLAVDDTVHVYHHWRYRWKKKVKACYSQTWSALGGERRSDGFWALALNAEDPPDYGSIKSSKRSAARKRWAALQAIYASIDANTPRNAAADTKAIIDDRHNLSSNPLTPTHAIAGHASTPTPAVSRHPAPRPGGLPA